MVRAAVLTRRTKAREEGGFPVARLVRIAYTRVERCSGGEPTSGEPEKGDTQL